MKKYILPGLIFLIALSSQVSAQNGNGVEIADIIEQILAVDAKQKAAITDIVFDAEFVEGEFNKEGVFEEKSRFVKKVYVKYYTDTTLLYEEYLEYYKDGELQSEKDLKKEAKTRKEKKAKRKAKDISNSMTDPFQSANKDKYEIEYVGVNTEEVPGLSCHHFHVRALEKKAELVNGDYYFDSETFCLAKADFSPAKLVKKAMFKLKSLNLSLLLKPTADGYWLPTQFDVEGKGKAMFFIGVKFAGTEYYKNPIINGGIDDSIFEAEDGK